MFGLFKKVTIDHSTLGLLQRRGREWHGNIELTKDKPLELRLEGPKHAPHQQTLDAAMKIRHKLPTLIPKISIALLDHCRPYQDGLCDPDDKLAELFSDPANVERAIAIDTPEEAWAASEIRGIEIGVVGTKTRLLIKIEVIWDEEHLLGAYFDDWNFRELNGSV